MQTKLKKFLPFAAFFLLFFVNLLVALHHEAWRDEAQAWLLAKHTSLPELFSLLPSEGHPCLWFLLLKLLVSLGLPFSALWCVSLAVTSLAAALLLWKAPFPAPCRALLLCSNLFLYYNPVIPRVYCLAALLCVCVAVFAPGRLSRPGRYLIFVALLFQTHVVLFGFAGGLMLEYAISAWREDRKKLPWLLLPLFSLVLSFLELHKSSSAGDARGTSLADLFAGVRENLASAGSTLRTLFGRYIGLYGHDALAAALLAGTLAVFLLYVLFILRKKQLAACGAFLLALLCGIGWIVFVNLFVYQTAIHTDVCLTAILLASAWMLFSVQAPPLRRCTLALALVFSLLSAKNAVSMSLFDLSGSYSGSREMASYMAAEVEEGSLVLLGNDPYCTAPVAYLEDLRPDLVFRNAEKDKPYTYYDWADAGQEDAGALSASLAEAQDGPVYLLSPAPLDAEGLTLVKACTAEDIRSSGESFYLYLCA